MRLGGEEIMSDDFIEKLAKIAEYWIYCSIAYYLGHLFVAVFF